jgi:hypothetical protein
LVRNFSVFIKSTFAEEVASNLQCRIVTPLLCSSKNIVLLVLVIKPEIAKAPH